MRLSPITIIIGIVGAYAYLKGRAADQLRIVASRATNIKGNLLTLRFDLEMTIQNFSDQNITVTGISGNVMFNGTPIASTLKNSTVTIVKNGYTKISVPTVIEFPYLVGAIKEYIVNFIAKKTSLSLGWSGVVSSLGIPFKVETEFDLIP
jgi:LEA14-like dessication related protein